MHQKKVGRIASKVRAGLENVIKLKNIDMKTLSVMKTMHAKQPVDLCNEFILAKLHEIVISESKAFSIYDTMKMGSADATSSSLG